MEMKPKAGSGFTIVEMAVSIVIIGLVVGGILAGADLIRSSKRQEVIKEYGRFDAAVNNFYLKYNGIPGDFARATSFWPTASNGNGDGRIDYNGSFVATGEEHYAWQHMVLAGMIEGDYNGAGADLESIPESKFDGYYRISYQSNVYEISDNMISLNGLKNGIPNGPIFSLSDMNSIEKIIDDGKADKGKVLGFNEEGVPGCVTNDYTLGSGDYVSNVGDKVICKAFFLLDNL